MEEFENIIVQSNPDGSAIKVSDVARVELASETYDYLGRVDLQPVAVIQVIQLADANAVELANNCNKKMENFPKTSLTELLMKYSGTLRILSRNL